jgi:hypothetical protein
MIHSTIIMVALSLVLGSTPTATLEEPSSPPVLVSRLVRADDAVTRQSAFLGLRKTLRKAPAATVKATQDALCQELASPTTDALTMRRICLVLAAAPCDDAVKLVVDRLQADTPPKVRAAACQSLRDLLFHYQPTDAKVAALAMSRLGAIARDRRAPIEVLDAAVLAMGAFGSAGLDALVALQTDPNASKQVTNVFYTALSDTGDPRALPVLRAAVTDARTREGHRIQVANAIGQLFRLAGQRGLAIDPGERTLCWQVLYQCLGDMTPDQLFGVALKSLVEVAPIEQDPTILQTINAALSSDSDVRREAALDALYRAGLSSDSIAWDLVRFCAESSADESVRNTAAAVLEQSQLGDEASNLQSPP